MTRKPTFQRGASINFTSVLIFITIEQNYKQLPWNALSLSALSYVGGALFGTAMYLISLAF
jgi:hypothetical protein